MKAITSFTGSRRSWSLEVIFKTLTKQMTLMSRLNLVQREHNPERQVVSDRVLI